MKIVAIGGGEIGRPKDDGTRYPIETRKIDEEIIKLTGKKHPRVLLLPTASGDSPKYPATFDRYYGKMLGCQTDVLYLIKEKHTYKKMREKVSKADIIYVGGGNTMRMLKIWRKTGFDRILEEAANQGKVLCGVSAGAICWFRYGNSDSMKFGPKRISRMIKLKGLDFIPIMACPHYDVEKQRRPELKEMVKNQGHVAIALENCSAFEFVDGRWRIITSSGKAKAFRVYRKAGKVLEEKLRTNGQRIKKEH
jgi:dipeptidase E